jgi:hypothetical protein
MKRILLVAVSSSALALAAPAIASAHHHGKHHHKHHGATARVLDFRASAPATGSPSSSAPTTPTTESAGKVASFKEGVLTITLKDGTSVSGKVTEQTEIHCSQPPTTGGEDNDDEAGSGQGDQGSSDQARASDSSLHVAHAADHGDEGDEGQQNCTTSALTEGALVGEAELTIGSGGAVWDRVDLIQ